MAIQVRQRVREDNKKPTRYYSSKQEKEVAKELGGKTTLNSGATSWQKGDIIVDNWMIECKTCTTDKLSFAIKKGWLEKNLQESLFMGKPYTALAFNFGPGQENYYIIDEPTFKEFLELQHKNVV